MTIEMIYLYYGLLNMYNLAGVKLYFVIKYKWNNIVIHVQQGTSRYTSICRLLFNIML